MDAAAELERNLVSKHQIQPEYGDEQADAGRYCRTRIARPNSTKTIHTEIHAFPFPLRVEITLYVSLGVGWCLSTVCITVY